MDLQKQVCSLELAKRLKELGVQQESVFAWLVESDGSGTLTTKDDRPQRSFYRADEWCSAFTVAELGELLPESIELNGEHFHLRITRGRGPRVVGTHRTRTWRRALLRVFDTVAAITRRAQPWWQNRKQGYCLEHPGR
jgi:hypothetical protein